MISKCTGHSGCAGHLPRELPNLPSSISPSNLDILQLPRDAGEYYRLRITSRKVVSVANFLYLAVEGEYFPPACFQNAGGWDRFVEPR